MQRHEDVVLNQIGTPIPGVTITVRVQDATPGSGALATIYSDDGTTVISGSAVTTDTHGRFFFFAPDGKYDLTVTGTGITTYILADIEIADVTERFSLDNPWIVDTQTVGKWNNVRVVDGVKFPTIQAAIDNLPSTGGIVIDPREGDKTLSSTITFNKPVQLYVSYGRYTSSASPILDFPAAGGDSAVIGPGNVDKADGGNSASFRGSSSAITPLIRIEGTDTSTRTQRVLLKNIAIKGEGDPSGQLGLLVNFATSIQLDHVNFFDLGQAEDIDDVFGLQHSRVIYTHSGSGNTAATATVRVENRSGTLLTEQIQWNEASLWEGKTTSGIGLYVGDETTQVKITDSKFDYGTNSTATSLVTFFKSKDCYISHTEINGASVSSLVAAVDVTGDGTGDSLRMKISDSHIAFGGAIGVRFAFTRASQVNGGTFVGDGTGTAVSATSDSTGSYAIGYKVDSNDTPWSDSGTGNGALYLEGAISPFNWQLRGAGLTLGNADWLRGRNAADSADFDLIQVSGTDFILIGDTGTSIFMLGTVRPNATGQALGTVNARWDAFLENVLASPLEGTLPNIPRWIFKQVDFGDMTAAATADTFTLWTLPANTMIHDVVGRVVTGWSGGSISDAVASVGTQAGSDNDLTLDDNFFAAGTRYELHDATTSGGKGTLLYDATDKFAPYMLVAGGVVELQMDLTDDNHANATAGQARIYMLVSQPLSNTTTEAN